MKKAAPISNALLLEHSAFGTASATHFYIMNLFHYGQSGQQNYADNTFLPFCLRRASTLRPFLVLILARKP